MSDSYADVSDPFGVGRENIYFSDRRAYFPDLLGDGSKSISREAFLTAFLSWWLCDFLIPSEDIRPEVFVVANSMARGHRISLAVPALANIYKSLRMISTSKDPGSYTGRMCALSLHQRMVEHVLAGVVHSCGFRGLEGQVAALD